MTAKTESILARHNEQTLRSSETGAKFSALAASLKGVLENGKAYPEDVYQAQSCLAWIHWHAGEWNLAIADLPTQAPDGLNATTEKRSTLSDWTCVCMVKCAFILGRYSDLCGYKAL